MREFVWYDLETFGRDPRRSRIAQFAALRTDRNLQPVEPPLVLYCQPADDLLPSPEACLITGITPQRALAEGLPEAEFAARIHDELSRPGTCVAGYNSLRFDDEFIRNLFYRNFFDPYEREYRNGNSRWDLIDPMRMARALRPERLEWPQREDGAPSFRLEDLARANGLTHEHAHDALSDVGATLALARRLREAQPKLFDYALGLRDKKRAAALLDYVNMTPVLHISSRFPAAEGSGRLVLPVCVHPRIGNQVIVADLSEDPGPLIELAPDAIRERLYTPREALPDGVTRIGLKQVYLNRSPILVALRHLKPEQLEVFHIDLEQQLEHARRLREAPGLADRVRAVFDDAPPDPEDPELAIYAGFASHGDRRLFKRVRDLAGSAPPGGRFGFRDARYEELAFRFRARNHPGGLDASERQRWQAWRARRLADGSTLSELGAAEYRTSIRTLREQHAGEPTALAILDALDDWGRQLGIGP